MYPKGSCYVTLIGKLEYFHVTPYNYDAYPIIALQPETFCQDEKATNETRLDRTFGASSDFRDESYSLQNAYSCSPNGSS